VSAPPVRVESAWSDDVVAFVATSPSASWGGSAAFRRAFERTLPAWPARLFVARDGARVRGVLAGYVERRFGGAWFRGMPFGAPAGPWLDAAADRADVARALWAALAQAARAEGWLGGDVTAWGGGGPGIPPAADLEVGAVRTDLASVVDLAAGPAAWRASLDNPARRMLSQAGRRGVTIERAQGGEGLDRVYALYDTQARTWGVRRVLPAWFYRELLVPPTDAALWVARLDGEVVCGVLAFVSPRETYAWWSGSAPAARGVRAFPATLERIAFECGSAQLNLGFSGARERLVDFKRQLGAREVAAPIVDLAPRPRTPYHALLAWARERGCRGRDGRPGTGAEGP
jgi:hypothetical protein